jgi:septal ring factor EnvC (AmiA/AmiB activator)
MHRLPLILCAIALLGTTVSAVLYLRIGNSKQLLELRLTESQSRVARLDSDLTAARTHTEELRTHTSELRTRVSALDVELARSNEKLVAAGARATQLERSLTDTRSVLAVYESTTRALGDEINALRRDLDQSRTSNASPEAVQAYKTTIAELERQLASARNGAALPSAVGASTAVFTSRAGRASILNVGPGNAFVVLNFGSARGAQLGHRLQVSQGNVLVATVVISDVRTNFSVAQVQPETLRGVLQKGDSAVLIR